MMNILIIDDEASSIELISNLLKLATKDIGALTTANSVQSGYEAIMSHQPDLVFLDVQMQDGTGFDLLNKLDKIKFKVIFITAHQEFAIKAFKYSALDYLLKPLSPVDFIESVKKAQESMVNSEIQVKLDALLHNIKDNRKKKIVLKTMDKIYAILTNEIIRLESEGSYTRFYLSNGEKVLVSRLIKDYDETLSDSGFTRVHQSHLVNLDYFYCFEKNQSNIVMRDGSVVPVSSRKKETVLNLVQNL